MRYYEAMSDELAAFIADAEKSLHSGHGRNVETEQTAADDGDGRDHVDVADCVHGARSQSHEEVWCCCSLRAV